MRDITIILLAAGESVRMGRDKLLLPFGGDTVISTVINTIISANLQRIVLVTSRDIANKAGNFPKSVEIVVNESPEKGQSRSMRLGLEHIRSSSVPFGIILGDMPLLSKGEITEVLGAFYRKSVGKTSVIPEKGGRFGHPCFFEPLWIGRLACAEGDIGGRDVIRSYWDEVQLIKAGKGCFTDIDTPEDYREIQTMDPTERRRI